ncbi:MAG: 1-acyl-sn-glycerol-3-phosphate acyltransferase [Fusobacteria bacterium]|nr:1-acyl-sn-glycerol-3-phosphate acyltransferase [Fusobacteriota bacterium]
MFRSLLSALLAMIFYILSAILLVPILLLLKKEKALIYAQKNAKFWGKALIVATGSKVEVIYKDEEDFKNIASNEPFLLVANHQSNLDIPLLTGYFPRNLGFVAKKEMEKWPILNVWMKRIKCVFLDRENPRNGIKDIKQAIGYIKEGYTMAIFPEGTRTKTGEIGEFQKGSIKIATDPKVKIVPVTIVGTMNIMGKNSKFVKGNKNLKLIIEKSIETNGLDKEKLNNLHNEIREMIISNHKSYSI